MANNITDQVLTEVMEMFREILWQHQEDIDTLYSDEDDPHRKVTVPMKINFTGKGESQIETKVHLNLTKEPGTPAKKIKDTVKRLIDVKQKGLFGNA